MLFVSATLSRATQTASCTSGIGRARSCTTSGRHTMMCVSGCYGIPMRPPRWPPVAGTGLSSTGTEGDSGTSYTHATYISSDSMLPNICGYSSEPDAVYGLHINSLCQKLFLLLEFHWPKQELLDLGLWVV